MGLSNRTTRGVALTKAGARLYQTLAPRMKEIVAPMVLGARPAGRVRLTLSDHALNLLWPACGKAFWPPLPKLRWNVTRTAAVATPAPDDLARRGSGGGALTLPQGRPASDGVP